MLAAAPAIYFAANAVGRVLDRLSDDAGVGMTLLTFALVPLATYALAVTQTAVNRILEKDGYSGATNSRATAGSIIVGILGALLWTFALLGVLAGL